MRIRTVVASLLLVSSYAQAQQGDACSTSSLNGTYFYVISGSVLSFNQYIPYVELGQFTANGQGSVFGQGNASAAGAFGPFSLVGSYTVQGDCTATLSLIFNSQFVSLLTFQIVNGGQSAFVARSSTGGVLTGQAYRAASSGGQCANGSFTGTYGYLIAGVLFAQFNSFYFSDVGQVVADGNGGISAKSVTNLGSGASTATGTGTYSIAADCSGTAQITFGNRTDNYIVAVGEGNHVLFLSSDAGSTISGSAQPQSSGTSALILSQVVGGGTEWKTTFLLTNPSNLAEDFTMRFFDDTGLPKEMPIEGLGTVDTISGNLVAGETRRYETGAAGTLQVAWAVFTGSTSLSNRLSGLAVFRQTVPSGQGTVSSEAVVDFVPPSQKKYLLLYDNLSGFDTTIMLTNPDPANPIAIQAETRDEQGNVLGIDTINLPPHGHTAFILRLGLPATLNHRGSVRLTSPQGFTGLGLRFSPFGTFTSFRLLQSADIP